MGIEENPLKIINDPDKAHAVALAGKHNRDRSAHYNASSKESGPRLGRQSSEADLERAKEHDSQAELEESIAERMFDLNDQEVEAEITKHLEVAERMSDELKVQETEKIKLMKLVIQIEKKYSSMLHQMYQEEYKANRMKKMLEKRRNSPL